MSIGNIILITLFIVLFLIACVPAQHNPADINFYSEGGSGLITQKSFSQTANCDFSPFIQRGGITFHRRKKAIFYVTPELLKAAEEAAELLSNRIGLDLFEMRDIDEPGDGGEIYIASEKSHFEFEKNKLEPGSYLAYCKVSEKYNKKTGEIYESDIVFNPILYDQPRDYYKAQKRSAREAIDYVEKDIDRKTKEREAYCESIKTRAVCDHYKGDNRLYNECTAEINNIYENCIADLKSWVKQAERFLEDGSEEVYNELKYIKGAIYTHTLKTMIHELGHALGYDHTPNDIENIMYGKGLGAATGSVLTGRQVNAVLCAFSLRSGLL